LEILKEKGEWGKNTTIIVTTDHGRGLGPAWIEHNSLIYGSSQVWLLAFGPQTPHEGFVRNFASYQQIDIRPTIESFFALPRAEERGLGKRIAELFFPGNHSSN